MDCGGVWLQAAEARELERVETVRRVHKTCDKSKETWPFQMQPTLDPPCQRTTESDIALRFAHCRFHTARLNWSWKRAHAGAMH
eukprot:4271180-Amphidinium_carterae.4